MVTTDTSPYGFGWVLEFDGQITAWYAELVTAEDRHIHGLAHEPSGSDQQVLCVTPFCGCLGWPAPAPGLVRANAELGCSQA